MSRQIFAFYHACVGQYFNLLTQYSLMTLSTKRSLLIALGALLRGKKIRYKYSTTKTLKKIVKCLFKIFNLQQAATVKLIKTKESEEFE